MTPQLLAGKLRVLTSVGGKTGYVELFCLIVIELGAPVTFSIRLHVFW